MASNVVLWGFSRKWPFQCNMSFCIHNEDTCIWKIFVYNANMLTTSHNMELKRKNSPMMMSSHVTHYKSMNLIVIMVWCPLVTLFSNPSRAKFAIKGLMTPRNPIAKTSSSPWYSIGLLSHSSSTIHVLLGMRKLSKIHWWNRAL
jgi:hypothetical protein